jgi:hypothetical protein
MMTNPDETRDTEVSLPHAPIEPSSFAPRTDAVMVSPSRANRFRAEHRRKQLRQAGLRVQYLKGESSHRLLSEFPRVRKRYCSQHLWGRGHWVASSGNVTDEVWKKYIEDQKPETPDDHLKVA